MILGILTAGELQKCSKREMGFLGSFEKKSFVQDFSSKINRLPLDAPLGRISGDDVKMALFLSQAKNLA
jgi:hypothetical protein